MGNAPVSSIRLPADLAARARDSGLSWRTIVTRGLDCTGHHADPLDGLTARIAAVEAAQLAHGWTYEAGQQRLTQWRDQLLQATGGKNTVTAADVAQAVGFTEKRARDWLRRLTIAGMATETTPERAGHRSPPRKRWTITAV